MATTPTLLQLPTSEKLAAAETAILDLQDDHIAKVVDQLAAYLRHDDQLEREELSAEKVMELAGFLSDARGTLRDMEFALDELIEYLAVFRAVLVDGYDDPATIGDYWALARKRRGNA